jgi:hypothetical protein
MVGRLNTGRIRAVALGLLVSWLPCMAVGLCMTAPAVRSTHGCCHGTPTLGIAAAPQECWLQSSAPLPAGPPPPALAAPVLAAHAQLTTERELALPAPATAFSPLAIVLRI